jgi:hypothetical protein
LRNNLIIRYHEVFGKALWKSKTILGARHIKWFKAKRDSAWYPMLSVVFLFHTLRYRHDIIAVVINNQPKQMTGKNLMGKVCTLRPTRALLDVLGDPLEPITIAHLADNTAHEHLKRPDIGVTKADLALPSCEVAKA